MASSTEIRRLAAVMFTDIQGYTALVQKDEQRAIKMAAISYMDFVDLFKPL